MVFAATPCRPKHIYVLSTLPISSNTAVPSGADVFALQWLTQDG